MSASPDPSSVTVDDRLDLVRLRRLVGSCRLGRRVVFCDSVGSTNDVARLAGREGGEDGLVVLADSQTAGRGRRQRVWESAPGLGLYLSVLMRPGPADATYPAALQLAAAVALAETLTPGLPEPVELLWPNDCVCVGQKLAGVLVESETTGPEIDFLVCGIGVNVNQTRSDFSREVGALASSVGALARRHVDRTELLARLLFGLEAWDDVARGGGVDLVAGRWLELAPSARGAEVVVETQAGTVTGRARGLSPRGGLVVELGGATREILTGELVRVRRRR